MISIVSKREDLQQSIEAIEEIIRTRRTYENSI